MADIAITAANTVTVSGTTEQALAGETITAGQAVYLDSSSGKYLKADADSATAAARAVRGIALNGASLNQPLSIQRTGDITIGGTLAANTAYYLSGTPGGICPLADVGTGEYMTLIGVAISTTVLRLGILSTGVAN